MIPFETFLLGALIVSTVTGLVTEALKKILIEHKWNHHANTLAGQLLSFCLRQRALVILQLLASALQHRPLYSWSCSYS